MTPRLPPLVSSPHNSLLTQSWIPFLAGAKAAHVFPHHCGFRAKAAGKISSNKKAFTSETKLPAPSSAKLSLHRTKTPEVPTPENLSFYLEVSSCFCGRQRREMLSSGPPGSLCPPGSQRGSRGYLERRTKIIHPAPVADRHKQQRRRLV